MKGKTKILICLTSILLLAIISISGISLAKYIVSKNAKSVVSPPNYAFNINYEDNTNGTAYNVANEISIDISNFVAEQVANENISYNVVVKDDNGNDITSSVIVSIDDVVSTSATLPANTKTINRLLISNLTNNKSYLVEIKSVSPFVKTLKAKFYTNEQDSYYTITDNGNFITLDIYTASNMANNLTITYGTLFSPDNTNSLMQSWINNTSGTIQLEPNCHYSLIFFENVPGDYTLARTMLTNKITL